MIVDDLREERRIEKTIVFDFPDDLGKRLVREYTKAQRALSEDGNPHFAWRILVGLTCAVDIATDFLGREKLVLRIVKYLLEQMVFVLEPGVVHYHINANVIQIHLNFLIERSGVLPLV